MGGKPLTTYLLTALSLWGIYIYRSKRGMGTAPAAASGAVPKQTTGRLWQAADLYNKIGVPNAYAGWQKTVPPTPNLFNP